MRREGGFSTIRDAVSHSRRKHGKFNFVGFVIEFGCPRKSDGTDYVVTLRIVDEFESELSVKVFGGTMEHLPRLKSYKDLIILNRLTIKQFDGEFFAVFYKETSSYALFDVKTNTNTPYQTSPGFDLQTLNLCLTSVQHMRSLSPHYQVTAGRNEYLISLKDLGTKMFFDLVCRVLHVEKTWNGGCVLFVWDGTDVPPLRVATNIQDEEETPLPLEVEQVTLNMSILRKFPCVGTVLRVASHVDMSVHFQEMGQWVKIRNMKCDELPYGFWRGDLQLSSKIRFLPDNEQNVVQCKRALDERGLGRVHRLPLGSIPLSSLTVVDSTGFPFATLMDLMTHTEVETTVRCVVRVVAISPSDVERFRNEDGEYRIILTLEDPTARIHGLLDGHHADLFFEDFIFDTCKRRKLNELLGCEGSYRNPPWIECCIKSNANRLYYVCQTKLKLALAAA